MTQPKNLPAGERLPEYDDEPRVDPAALLAWLREHYPHHKFGTQLDSINRAIVDHGYLTMIGQVLQALQAVGGAQLVKNDTYRAMARDGREIERLSAWLANNEPETMIIHAGDPVGAAIDLMQADL